MARYVYQYSVTIPAGTEETAPATSDIDLDNYDIESIDLEVPPGPAGLMGFAVFNNGQRWLPVGDNAWLVWDDVQQSWYLSDQPNASGWAIVGYNTGTYDHAVTVRMHVNPTNANSPVTLPPRVTFVSTVAAPNQAVTLG